jgi:DNA end-binding protein Ku
MPPRSSWKGFLRLSLVSVPVKAYTASATSAEIHLRQLHKDCHNPVKYKKTCPLHGELKASDIISGYEYAKDQFVVVDTDELEKLRKQSDRAIGIDGFIADTTVDPMYYSGRTYYLTPDGPVGQRPYALLHKAMVENNLHAVARVVLLGKEQLVLVRPVDGLLVMSGLVYKSQVKSGDAFKDEVLESEVGDDELELAQKLVDASRIEDFDLDRYKDLYTERLGQLIEAKVDGKEIVAPEEADEPQVINLIEALKKSVEAASAREAGKGKKMAVSSRKPAAKRKKKSG